MHDTRILPAAACQLALACNLTTAYYMLTMGEGMPGWFFPQITLLYGPFLYLLNRLFLKKERSMLALGGLNLALCAAVLGGYLLLEPWRGIAYFAFAALFCGWLTLRGCASALRGPSLRGTLLTLDAAFLLLIAFISYSSATSVDFRWNIPAVLALCAAMISAVILRSDHSPGLKGWLAVAGAFAVLFALLWLVIGMAAPAGQGLVAIWSALAAGINAVKALLWRGILFLLSLLPNADPEGGEGWTEFGEAIFVEETPAAEVNPIWGVILLILFSVGAIIAVIWLIGQLRRIKLRAVSGVQAPSVPRRERVPLWQGILRLLKGWYTALKLRLWLWQGRNTPEGLYFLLVHRCRRAPWHKLDGETPRQFLLRLCESTGGDGALSNALKQLARDTDAALYSNRPALGHLPYAPLIRRRLGTALRLHFFRRLASRLHFAKP